MLPWWPDAACSAIESFAVLVANVADDDLRAVLDEDLRFGGAEALRSAGHDGDLACHAHEHRPTPERPCPTPREGFVWII